MINRWTEDDLLLDTLEAEGMGCISFAPLAQGMLTDKYLHGIPEGSRAAQGKSLDPDLLSDEVVRRLRGLNDIAARRGQSLAQLALRWVLRDERMTSALIGASSVAQLEANIAALDAPAITDGRAAEIDEFAKTTDGVNIWAAELTRPGAEVRARRPRELLRSASDGLRRRRRSGRGHAGRRPRAGPPGHKKRAGPWGGYGPARGGVSTITLRGSMLRAPARAAAWLGRSGVGREWGIGRPGPRTDLSGAGVRPGRASPTPAPWPRVRQPAPAAASAFRRPRRRPAAGRRRHRGS